MNSLVENQIKKYIADNKILERKLLSKAFSINCEKIILSNKDTFVAKYYSKPNNSFNSIVSETNSLLYLTKKFPLLFPKVKYNSNDFTDYEFYRI